MTPPEALAAAMRHHQAGRLVEAERLYLQVLTVEPGNLQALTLSGAIAHLTGRHDCAVERFSRALAISEQPDLHYNLGLARWALGQRKDAIAHWSRALALNPHFAPAHMNLGNALREEGRLPEAIGHLRRAAELQPSPFVHNNLGLALASLGDREAIAHYQRAIAMHPTFIEPYLNLALHLARTGDLHAALGLVRRSLSIQETPENKALFVRLAGALDTVADDAALRALVTRAALETWGEPASLAPVAATLLKHGSAIAGLIDRAKEQQAPAFSVTDLAGAANEPLLRWLLESEVVCDIELERFLTGTRASLLELAEAEPDALNGSLLAYACALARQCFMNEYVYALREGEQGRAERLRAALTDVAERGGVLKPAALAVVAAYFPLHAVAFADALAAGAAEGPLAAVVAQQVGEPRAEAQCRTTIPKLTPIEDSVSRQVQEQYEQNPYPRWIAAPHPQPCESADALIARDLPHAPYRPTGKGGDLDILVAGCGTGRQAIAVARQFERARVLAIDLSAASLGYAKARSSSLGVGNVEYAQADILQLCPIDRTFDMIQSDGVLHHLGNPWIGWRVLLSLLRPGGLMHVSLYSEIARRDVVAARAFIAEHHYPPTPDGIRACRHALMAQPQDSRLRNLTVFNDFFSTSECRDLLFHVQEHRLSLPAIKDFLTANDLQFLGFDPDFRVTQAYTAQAPGDPAMIDLDRWHAFELERPDTFAGMYRFWIQKGA